jgi:hypothetical protein
MVRTGPDSGGLPGLPGLSLEPDLEQVEKKKVGRLTNDFLDLRG